MKGKIIKTVIAVGLAFSMTFNTGIPALANSNMAETETGQVETYDASEDGESTDETTEESIQDTGTVESTGENIQDTYAQETKSIEIQTEETQMPESQTVTETEQAVTVETETVLQTQLESETIEIDSFAGSSIATATSISLGKTYQGMVSETNKKNYYKFTIPSSGRVTNTAIAHAGGINYFIYDSAGNEVYHGDPGWNSTTGQSSVDDTIDLTKGTYYFAVIYSWMDGSYSFNLSFGSANESFTETNGGTNNSMARANGISLNTSYKGQIAGNDTIDYYKFTIGSSGRITNYATAEIATINYYIYDTSGNELYHGYSERNSVTGQSSIEDTIDLTKGTYYFAVAQNYGTGNYSFKLQFASAGESFTETGNGTDNTMATARNISLGKTYKGQIAVNDDKDYYKFTVSSTGRYVNTATAYMRGVNYYIYDLSGHEVYHGDAVWNETLRYSSITDKFELEKGTYYFVVTRYLDYGNGNYSFKLSSYAQVTGISLNKSNATLTEKGQTLQLTASVKPDNATNKDVEWSSSDSSVASVNDHGLVTAKNNGTATITAKTKENEKTARCVVTVYNMSTEGASGFVYRLYTNMLNRQPDISGHSSWVSVLQKRDDTGAGVAWGFVFSTEVKNQNLSNTEFVKRLYRTFLDREADSAGLSSWVKQLDNGISREMIFKGFAESAEFTSICRSYGITRGNVNLAAPRDQNAGVTMFVFRCYQKALGRNADTSGLNNWANVLLTHKETPKQVAHGFIFSPEMNSKNLSNREFIKVLYRVFLDREADSAGLESWVRVLEQEGKSREHVFNGFADSPEFQKIVASYGL